jgi:hypothetical protein
MTTDPATFSGKLITKFNLKAEVMRTREKKPIQSASDFSLKTLWA